MVNDGSIPVSAPPRLFSTLGKGFNIVANHIQLILIPVVIDPVLWLGPKLRVRQLLLPTLNDFINTSLAIVPADMKEFFTSSQSLWQGLLDQFNLFTTVRTIPVGVPSLMARLSPITSPLKGSLVLESPSSSAAVAVLGAMLLLGFALGTLYFDSLNRYSAPVVEKLDWKRLGNEFVQSVALFVILILLAILVSMPLMLITSVLTLLSPGIGQIVLLLGAFIIIWMLVPLVFAPHGIFVQRYKAFYSLTYSLRLVRAFLPGTGMFVMVSALISESLNMLWQLPESANWLTLVGIGGHAFVVTGLIAATFVYYREGIGWMQYNMQRFDAALKQQNGGVPLAKQ